jgi:hypothetical protein
MKGRRMATKKKKPKTPQGTKDKPTITAKGKRIGRPPMADKTIPLPIRVPVELVEALDAYAAHLAKETPWSVVTRGDVARRLMMRGLAEAGFMRLPLFSEGFAVGGKPGQRPVWKPNQYRAPDYLHPMPSLETHPEWFDEGTPREDGEE